MPALSGKTKITTDYTLTLTNGKNYKAKALSYEYDIDICIMYVKDLIDNQILGDIRYIYSQRLNLGRIRSDVEI